MEGGRILSLLAMGNVCMTNLQINKCLTFFRICDDYDLCEECEAKPREDVHDKTDLFIKLRRPVQTTPSQQRPGPPLVKVCFQQPNLQKMPITPSISITACKNSRCTRVRASKVISGVISIQANS